MGILKMLFGRDNSEWEQEIKKQNSIRINVISKVIIPESYFRVFKTKVVGVTHENIFPIIDDPGRISRFKRQAIITSFCKPGDPVILCHEPSNEYDPNAVMVLPMEAIGDNGLKTPLKIGYLKTDLAADLVDMAENGGSIYAEIAKILGGVEGAETKGVLLEVFLF